MKTIQYLAFSLIFLSACHSDQLMPQPGNTVVRAHMEEDGKGEMRREFMKQVHRAAPDVDWQSMEYQTSMEKHLIRAEKRNSISTRSNVVSIADGQLKGEWRERGSANQAGSVVATEYDEEEDILYLISAGGSLFKGTIDGLGWEVVNQDLRFGERFLRLIEHNGTKRMLAIVNRIPHYSDDLGETWVPATGIQIDDRWGDSYHAVVEPGTNRVYLLSKPSYWTALKLFVSEDGGETFQVKKDLQSHDAARYYLLQPRNGEKVFLVDKLDESTFSLSSFDPDTGEEVLEAEVSQTSFKESRANLAGVYFEDAYHLYIYNSDREVWRSFDLGQTWEYRGKYAGSPWAVGLFVSPSNPNIMLMGEVECYRSTNGGQRWTKINGWAEYYGDVVNKLHADMMYFNEFEDADGEPFLLISNHGGLSISRNGGARNLNIGLYGLNVSQYYSVRTDPVNPDIIYAGSQDQGFQRGEEGNPDWVEFDQVISGDYGHIIFTANGQKLWTVYPGGSVSYYDNPHINTWPTRGFQIESEHESVWIPPMVPHPDPSRNAIYVAGGSIDGGEGSYVISAELVGDQFVLDQWSTDFRMMSGSEGGRVGAMAFSPVDPNKVYVATNNGVIFYSNDGGESFDRSLIKVAGSHYLYGTTVVPSKYDADVVYVGGSGYSTSPVMKSEDGGRTFRPMRDGLPSTVVFQLATNDNESVIYAATEAGPYAYLVSEEKWYDISGTDAPVQTYWSVEYLPDERLARFGTYGRGIWDFEERISTSTDGQVHSMVKVYPNPTSDVLIVEGADQDVFLINIQGQVVRAWTAQERIQDDISDLPAGSYMVKTKASSTTIIKK